MAPLWMSILAHITLYLSQCFRRKIRSLRLIPAYDITARQSLSFLRTVVKFMKKDAGLTTGSNLRQTCGHLSRFQHCFVIRCSSAQPLWYYWNLSVRIHDTVTTRQHQSYPLWLPYPVLLKFLTAPSCTQCPVANALGLWKFLGLT